MPKYLHAFFARLRPMLSSGLWVGSTTIIKAVSQLIVLKWIAVEFTPATMGVAGQAMSLISVLQVLAGGGIANGIIRQFAIECEDREKRDLFLSASFTYGLIFSILFLLLAVFGANGISQWAFDSKEYSWFVLLLGVSSFFSFLTIYAQSLLSAQSLVRPIFWANLLGLGTGIAAFAILMHNLSEPGILLGLLALIVGPAVFFVIQLSRLSWFAWSSFKPRWNTALKKDLVPFTLIATIGGALIPIIFVLLRSDIEDKMGWDYAGYWQAILKISDLLFSFISLFMASTFYPRVAAAKSGPQALSWALQFALPFSFLLSLALAFTAYFGETALGLIFSDQYRFLAYDLNILLLSAFFRALAWLCAYFLMARNHLKLYLAFEVIASVALYLVCAAGLEYGFTGLVWGQVIHAIGYLVLLFAGVIVMTKMERT